MMRQAFQGSDSNVHTLRGIRSMITSEQRTGSNVSANSIATESRVGCSLSNCWWNTSVIIILAWKMVILKTRIGVESAFSLDCSAENLRIANSSASD